MSAPMPHANQTFLRALLALDWPPSIAEALRTLAIWQQRRRTRSQLRRLDAERLPDLGLTEYARAREGAKWFWEA